jgi:hypothetical protein
VGWGNKKGRAARKQHGPVHVKLRYSLVLESCQPVFHRSEMQL